MPDTADTIQENQALESNSLLIEAHKAAAEIPEGHPGFCRVCEEHSLRLVNDMCAPCRDEFEH